VAGGDFYQQLVVAYAGAGEFAEKRGDLAGLFAVFVAEAPAPR